MHIAVSTQLYDEARLSQLLPLLERDSALGVEIFPEWQLTRYEPVLQQVLPWLEGRHITFHGPYWDIDPCFAPTEPEFALFMKYWHKTLALAERLQARYVVYHLYNHHFASWERKEKYAAAMTALQHVQELAQKYGVLLAIENTETDPTGACNLLTQQEYVDLVRCSGCAAMIDVGHARCAGWDVTQLIAQLADCIEGYHLHNNDGCSDSHHRVLEGVLDMEQVVAAICRHTPRAALTLEYNPRLGISNGEVGEDIQWLRCADNVKRKKENI